MQKPVRALRYAACALGVAALVVAGHWLALVNATTFALLNLLLVLWIATAWGLAEATFTSVLGVAAFNFFFLPPLGTFTISEPQNWVALASFLVTAVTASQLSAKARRRAEEAVARRNEISTLYELSRAMLMDDAQDAIRVSVAKTGQLLKLRHTAFFDAGANQVYGSLGDSGASQTQMESVAVTGQPLSTEELSIIPVRLGTMVVGSLALGGGKVNPHTQESVASLLAINYERVRALHRAATAEIARQNEEFKSSLLDGLAHDLKTPLTAIRTCVTRLITIPPRTEEARQEMLSIIDQESERLQRTISEAIELARIESQKVRLQRETVNLAEVARVAVAEVRDGDSQRYAIDVPEEITVEADASLVRKVLGQLLENAVKYSPPGSPIEVSGSVADDAVRIEVRDRGPGIAPDELAKVFGKFYRGRKTNTSAVEGTGMGLAIAKGIIEAHGGKIHAERRTGGGTVIAFTLPAHSIAQ